MSSNNKNDKITFTVTKSAKKIIIAILMVGIAVFVGLIVIWATSGNMYYGLAAMTLGLALPFIMILLLTIAHVAYRQSCKRAYEKGKKEDEYRETHLRPGTVLVDGRVVEVEKFGDQLRLMITHKFIKRIPLIEGLDQVVDLQILFLNDNMISRIEGLDKLTQLRTLSLSNNLIKTIEGLGTLVNLTYLNLKGNPIEWPAGLSEKSSAQEIVSYCQKLPPQLPTPVIPTISVHFRGKTINIKDRKFGVNGNMVKFITEIQGLDKIPDLLELYFGQNRIKKIEGLRNLPNLQKLDFNGNQITKIEGLDQLTNLRELNISNNKIQKIEGLDKLTQLRELVLYSNPIVKLEGLESLVNLKKIDLYDTPIAAQVGKKSAQDLVIQCRNARQQPSG